MSMLLTEVHVGKYLLTESKTRPGVFEVTGVMQRANAKNHNGRIYKKNLLEREVSNYIENFVDKGIAYGELDHPESPIVSLKNASHIVKELWWKGDDLMGRVELLNTPSGNIVKAILEAGYAIGTSSRGTGSVQQTNEGYLEVQNDFELVCWDFVSNPSTHGAFLKPTQALQESTLPGQNKYGKLDQIIREVICATTCECSL
jgi:hypothetical protein